MENNEIKILLTINLEGGTLVRKSEKVFKYSISSNNSRKAVRRRGVKPDKVCVFTHKPLEAEPCFQKIRITKEYYESMVSPTEVPYWSKPSAWKAMSKKQRLESYFEGFCHDIHGTSYSYELVD